MNKSLSLICSAAFVGSGFAAAEPGLGSKVYGPGVSKGESEIELITGYLTGGAGDGEWAAVAEASHAFTDFWIVGVRAEVEREPGADAEFEAWGIENIFDFTATRNWPVHLGGYAEYEFTKDGPDKAEFKLLAETQAGPVRLRGNLITERQVGAGAADEWEFGYATQALIPVNDDFSIGVEGYGEAGNDDAINFGDNGHYWGPVIEGELFETPGSEVEFSFGYLAGFGEAEADGLLRFVIEYAF